MKGINYFGCSSLGLDLESGLNYILGIWATTNGLYFVRTCLI
jgi:hypothetical protein